MCLRDCTHAHQLTRHCFPSSEPLLSFFEIVLKKELSQTRQFGRTHPHYFLKSQHIFTKNKEGFLCAMNFKHMRTIIAREVVTICRVISGHINVTEHPQACSNQTCLCVQTGLEAQIECAGISAVRGLCWGHRQNCHRTSGSYQDHFPRQELKKTKRPLSKTYGLDIMQVT